MMPRGLDVSAGLRRILTSAFPNATKPVGASVMSRSRPRAKNTVCCTGPSGLRTIWVTGT